MSDKTRFELLEEPATDVLARFADDVRRGLQAEPKRLSCRYFYDDLGSALFEEICALEEYYLWRAENEIYARHAGEIAAGLPAGAALVELGSGSATKTRLLIEACVARSGAMRYLPIDVSRAALLQSAETLLAAVPALSVSAIAAEYEQGLARAKEQVSGPWVLAWLGSNIGNLDRSAAASLLARARRPEHNSDRFLIGVDLRKERAVLEAAYDDPQGVTARFNLNLLARVNRELGSRFQLESFAHRAVYEEAEGRVRMYLVSRRDQEVEVPGLGRSFHFARGEAIHTEDSYKYSWEEIEALAAQAGMRIEAQLSDRQRRFATVVLALG